MTTHYHGSKGPVEIASMNPHHLASAHDKLVRERIDNTRDAEIAAMAERLAVIDEATADEPQIGTPISQLSGRVNEPGFDKFAEIAASWGVE